MINEGTKLYKNGKYKIAYAKYDEAILHDDSNKIAYYGRALASIKLGDRQNTISDLKNAAQ